MGLKTIGSLIKGDFIPFSEIKGGVQVLNSIENILFGNIEIKN